MHVPFLDLRAQHDPIRAELVAAFLDVIDSSAFAGGPFVAKFEHAFAAFCEVPHAVGVGNGTDALWLALLALGLKPGDEVITVAATFAATTEAIVQCGAKPVYVDIDPMTYTLDPGQLEAAITPRTRAVLPVHLYGQMADMDPIMAIAERHGLWVVEDACQAHGARYKGRRAGSIGHAGCFSFYPGKNLGGLGEAGAVATHSAELAATLRCLREHGQEGKYQHTHFGWNCRMDGIQAAALTIKLRGLEAGNAARRFHAARYAELLADHPAIALPHIAAHNDPACHLYPVRIASRDRVLRLMQESGVVCGVHYPVPIHLMPAYSWLNYRAGDLPVTERLAAEALSLPIFPELTPPELETVATALRLTVARAGQETPQTSVDDLREPCVLSCR